MAGRWFSPVSSTNKTDRLDITEILLKVALNTITLTHLANEEQNVTLIYIYIEVTILYYIVALNTINQTKPYYIVC